MLLKVVLDANKWVSLQYSRSSWLIPNGKVASVEGDLQWSVEAFYGSLRRITAVGEAVKFSMVAFIFI
jgi:hypothetical protein